MKITTKLNWKGLGGALSVAFLSLSNAYAHTVLTTPAPRETNLGSYSGNQTPPCGAAATAPTATYQAGSTVTLKWEVTIHHKGIFQLFFSPNTAGSNTNDPYLSNGLNTYPGPSGTPNPAPSITPLMTFAQDDNTALNPPYLYTETVTLPNTPTAAGTLQLVQVATDNGTANDEVFFYFTCSDVTLTSGVPSPTPSPSPSVTPSSTPSPTPTPTSGNGTCGTPNPLAPTFTNVNAQVIQPYCISCHNATTMQGGFNFSSYAGVLGAVDTGTPTSSLIYSLTENGTMPNGGPQLSNSLESLILQWIQAGAPNN